MAEDDLSWIENSLGCSLPDGYRKVMIAYPLDPDDINSQIALMNDRAVVVAFNQEMRDGEFASEWSADRLAIGTSPFGDTFFIDLTEGALAVYCWDHETHEVSSSAVNLDTFIAEQVGQEAESRRRKQPPVSSPKPWWKFWR